jgi:two-component system CheB/CheR fusion protein
VADLLDRIRQEFEAQAQRRGLGLRIRHSPADIHSDADLLQRIVRNLVANAIKFTESGRVLVACRRRGAGLRIEVWDTGPGIPAGKLNAIFEEFFRIDNPEHQTGSGYGVGLAISRSLAQLLQHRLDVRSRPGRGSVFAVEVPLANTGVRQPSGIDHVAPVPYTGPPGARVLLLEDDPDVRAATRLLLESLGLVLAVATDTEQALAGLQRAGAAVDLIIADYQLPEGTGVRAVQRLRGALERDVPALLVTGDTLADSVRDMEASGCRILRKPVDANALVAELNRLLDR